MKPNGPCFPNETCFEGMTQQIFEHKIIVASKFFQSFVNFKNKLHLDLFMFGNSLQKKKHHYKIVFITMIKW